MDHLYNFTNYPSKILCRGNHYVYLEHRKTYMLMSYINDVFYEYPPFHVKLNNDYITYLIYSHPMVDNNQMITYNILYFYDWFKNIYIHDILWYIVDKTMMLSNHENMECHPIFTYFHV